MSGMSAKEAERLLDAGKRRRSCRNLVVVFGDQLTTHTPAFDGFDAEHDIVLMMEVRQEAEHVPSSRQRTIQFLAAMRHFALELVEERGYAVRYVRLDDASNTNSFDSEFRRAVETLGPEHAHITWPGEHRVMSMVHAWQDELDTPISIHEDTHFLTSTDEFAEWMDGRKSVLLEHFYRWQRKRLGVLMEENGKDPVGGKWNYDHDNREAFKSTPRVRKPYTPQTDMVTQRVIEMVAEAWPDGYGSAESFRWPVTRTQALRALDDFIEHRLPKFGKYEDAMWTSEPYLYHSLISATLNLKLLNPRECVEKALHALDADKAPLNAVEGFVRQLIGWREFIRGVYWHEGPEYGKRNFLDQHASLPEFYWTGETDMNCMRECLSPVINDGYSHHIPRLMVLGNFALLAGVHPHAITDWFLAMYVDAVDWVTTPNTLGMSQHADGVRAKNGKVTREPVVGTKPYASSARYINSMSNFCEHCKYDKGKRTGENACPFNTLYWDFLIRHEDRFARNNRMAMIMKNVERMKPQEKAEITREGKSIKRRFGVEGG